MKRDYGGFDFRDLSFIHATDLGREYKHSYSGRTLNLSIGLNCHEGFHNS